MEKSKLDMMLQRDGLKASDGLSQAAVHRGGAVTADW
jgi:hypothetical protein